MLHGWCIREGRSSMILTPNQFFTEATFYWISFKWSIVDPNDTGLPLAYAFKIFALIRTLYVLVKIFFQIIMLFLCVKPAILVVIHEHFIVNVIITFLTYRR